MPRNTPVRIEGQRFGRLVAVRPLDPRRTSDRWLCRCDCGREHTPLAHNLRSGSTRSCGCLHRERAATVGGWVKLHHRLGHTLHGPAAEMIGRTFERLTVRELVRREHGSWRVRCDCACGGGREVLLHNLLSGMTRSCGCLQTEARRAQATHGLSGSPLYAVWHGMLGRCEDTRNPGYPRYGGRGITVCAGWHDVAVFAADMGERPSDGHSIDRVDNDGGYWCGRCEECAALGRARNVRWATQREQMRNTRANVHVVLAGVRENVSDVCRRNGVSRQLLHVRVARLGWTIERACTTPPEPGRGAGGFRRHSRGIRKLIAHAGHERRRELNAAGVGYHRLTDYAPRERRRAGRARRSFVVGAFDLTLAEWSLLTGIPTPRLRARFLAGWPANDVFAPVRVYHSRKAA